METNGNCSSLVISEEEPWSQGFIFTFSPGWNPKPTVQSWDRNVGNQSEISGTKGRQWEPTENTQKAKESSLHAKERDFLKCVPRFWETCFHAEIIFKHAKSRDNRIKGRGLAYGYLTKEFTHNLCSADPLSLLKAQKLHNTWSLAETLIRKISKAPQQRAFCGFK